MLFIALFAVLLIPNYDIIKKIKLGEKGIELETFKRDVAVIKKEAFDQIREEINNQAGKIQKLLNEAQETKTKIKEQIETMKTMSSNYNILEKRVSTIENNNKSKLNEKYQDYQVAGIKEKDIIVPDKKHSEEINIDWASAKIIEDTNDKIKILMPNITYKTNKFINTSVTINKRVGTKYIVYKLGNYVVEIEVLSVEKELTVIAIGVVKH